MTQVLPIPEIMRHPLLLDENEWHYKESLLELEKNKPSFQYDLAFYCGQPAIHPWEKREESIEIILKEWEVLKQLLKPLYHSRKSQTALPKIVNSLQLYTMLLFWGNGKPVVLNHLLQELSLLQHKPINLVERFSFILEKPTLYHSFIQLGELFEETKKHLIKAIAVEKLKRKG